MRIPPRRCRPGSPICERHWAPPWERAATRDDDDDDNDQLGTLRVHARCHFLTVVSSIIPKNHTDFFNDQIVPNLIYRLQNIFYLSRNIYSIDVYILSIDSPVGRSHEGISRIERVFANYTRFFYTFVMLALFKILLRFIAR